MKPKKANKAMQRNGGSSRLDMDTLLPPSADGGRSHRNVRGFEPHLETAPTMCAKHEYSLVGDAMAFEPISTIRQRCPVCKGTGIDPHLPHRYTKGGHNARDCEGCNGECYIYIEVLTKLHPEHDDETKNDSS